MFKDMESEDRMYAMIWLACAFVIAIIISGAFMFNSFRHAKIADMVKAGADPVLAMCAVDTPQDRAICTVPYLVKQAK